MSAPDPSMQEMFWRELETQVEELAAGIIQLEQDPTGISHIQAMMRAAHSIKGAARIVGFGDAVRLAHELETCFEAVGRGEVSLTAEDCDQLLEGVDILRRYREPASLDDHEALTALRGLVEPHIARVTRIMARTGTYSVPLPSVTGSGATAPGPTDEGDVSTPPALHPLVAHFLEASSEPRAMLASLLAESAAPAAPAMLSAALDATARLTALTRLAGLAEARERVDHIHAALREVKNGASWRPALATALRAHLEAIEDPARLRAPVHPLPTAPAPSPAREVAVAVPESSTATPRVPASTPSAAVVAPPFRQPPASIPASTPPMSAAMKGFDPPRPPAARVPSLVDAAMTASTDAPALTTRGAAPTAPVSAPQRFVRITSENLDRLLGLAGESLVQANWLQPFAASLQSLRTNQSAIATQLERLRELYGPESDDSRAVELLQNALSELMNGRLLTNSFVADMENYARQSAALSDRLYREVVQSRMRPVGDGMRAFPRLVRDLARKLGRSAHLEIEGEDTEVDRDILDKLEAPLNHLLRNAVDHGIEAPDERVARGKPPQGRVLLQAAHRAGMLWMRLADDGRGIDFERVRERIVEREIVDAEAARLLGETELIDHMFSPGFSTAKTLSEISGRGVGLDVVRATVGALGGSVHATSEPGRGTVFELELPLTLSVVRALLVEIAGEPYALPVTRLEQILHLEPEDVFTVQGRRCCAWNGHNIGLVPATSVLDLEPTIAPEDMMNVLVLRDRHTRVGFCVDRLLGEHDLVVRPITKRLGKIPDISASAVMPNGQLVLIIDIDDVIRNVARLHLTGRLIGAPQTRGRLQLLRRRVLVADDSESVRELECRMLENRGFETHTASDGEEALAQLAASHFDLLVTDADMPKLDGFELIRRVRAIPAFAELPIVMVSYNETTGYSQRSLAAGANRYVTKSQITTGVWLETVEDLLGPQEKVDRGAR